MPDELDEQYVMRKLKEILDDSEISTKDKLAALKLAGTKLGMFSKQGSMDIRMLVAQLSSDQLNQIGIAPLPSPKPRKKLESKSG